MRIINNLQQGSQEWLDIRLGIPTASDFSKIITSKGEKSTSLRDYAFQVASELQITEQEEVYKNEAMQRGNDLEDEARQIYQEKTFNIVKEIGFVHCKHYGYSPDGFVDDNGIIEIKCPNQKTHTKYLYNKKLPTIYKAQVQGGLLATDRKWCDFVSYHPNFNKKQQLLIVRVHRDEEFITKLKEYLVQFDKLKKDIINNIN